MKTLSALFLAFAAVAGLGGCAVVPIGPPGVYVDSGPVVVRPGPVVVRPYYRDEPRWNHRRW